MTAYRAFNNLTRRVLVRSPRDAVAGALRAMAGEGDGRPGSAGSFALRAPIFLSSIAAEIALTGETIAHLRAERSSPDNALVSVAWEPAGGAAFPRFAGRMWPEAETLCTSWLRLEGHYEVEAAGLRIADPGERTIGHRIARATAKLLLDDVVVAIARLRAA